LLVFLRVWAREKFSRRAFGSYTLWAAIDGLLVTSGWMARFVCLDLSHRMMVFDFYLGAFVLQGSRSHTEGLDLAAQ